jgi:uncharacterized protein YraI
MFRKLTSIILFALLLVYSIGVLNAQNVATLTAGTPALVRLSQEAPINILAFSGNGGDLIQAQIIALQPDLNPRVSLQSPTQQTLATSALNADGNSGTLSFLLPETGTYSFLIGGNAGDYLVSLSSLSTTEASRLDYTEGQAVVVGSDPQVFAINIPADGRATLSVSAGQFRDYVLSAFDGEGQHIATVTNTSFVCLVIAPQTTLVLSSTLSDVTTQDSVALRVGIDCHASDSPQLAGPIVVNPTSVPQTGSSACSVVNGGAVNVRSGAGTNYGVIGQLNAGSTTPVIGRVNAEWVQISSPFGVGFVSTSVVTLTGDCNNIPTVSGGEQPAQPVQPTQAPVQPEQPTQAPEQPVQPTQAPEQPVQPTEAPVQPTEAPTEAPTDDPIQPEPTAQVAAPDGNFTANINIDGTTVLSDYVSYPNGDTEDVIFYRVDGLNNSVALPGGQADFTVVLTCSGEGTQYIQMELQGATYSCGQVGTRRVNFDSNNGVVRIRAVGGDATYVQWTLNVSAPRVN